MDLYRLRLRGFLTVALLATAFGLLNATAQAAPPPAKSGPDVKKAAPVNPISKLDPELQAAIRSAPTASQWPNNDYVRLLDLGDVTIKQDGTIVAVYRETYKLFNERARPLAEVNRPYNSSYQSLEVVRARTIKKDGTILNVKPEDIRSSSPYSDYLMYDDAMNVGFSMPGIEDDCIIDYTVKMVTRPLLMPGQFWTYWGFSGPEPVSLCRYVLHVPADKPIQSKIYNDDTLKPVVVTSTDGHSKTYTWERRDLKPIELEPAMPNIQDVRIWMEVSSLGSWQDVAHWFWGLEQPQARPTDTIRATVNQLIANKKTDEEKAQAIYDWVANHTRYVGLEFGLSAFRPHAAREVHDKLYGDCKDKATLLITMLSLAGIKAHPVLLHAAERRPVGQGLPSLNAFNHCIALADVAGKEVWLDATAETCAYGDIPDGDRGVEALVVRDGKGEFQTIPTYQPAENGMDGTTRITVRPDGSADTLTTLKMRGAAGQEWRAYVRAITPDKRQELMLRIAKAYSTGATLKDFALPDGMEKAGPYEMKMTIHAPGYAHKTGNLLLLPIGGGTSSSDRRNPFVKDKRTWPIVEEDSSLTRSETVLDLPDGYVVDDLPANVDLTCPIQEFHRTLVKSADGKTITISETIIDHPGKVPPSDYAKVKDYNDAVSKANDDQIVLKKAK